MRISFIGKKAFSGLLFCAFLSILPCLHNLSAQGSNFDPLPSWNEGNTKSIILDFVKKAADASSADFISPPERIVVFDNDGTLITEEPIYFQMFYARTRIIELSHLHPEWDTLQPFKALIGNDLNYMSQAGTDKYTSIMIAAREGLNSDEQRQSIQSWLDSAVHPHFNKKYIELVYQPMLELLAYLGANGFKTFIVSGGDTGFMRVFSETVYGIPPEQVVGSFGKTKYEVVNGKPSIIPLNELEHINNKDGKAVGIYNFIGRIPVAAFGNSDGDYEMLQYSTSGFKNHLGFLVHHTDSLREYAYDKKSLIGKLDKGLNDASQNGWVIIDMDKDWKVVFK